MLHDEDGDCTIVWWGVLVQGWGVPVHGWGVPGPMVGYAPPMMGHTQRCGGAQPADHLGHARPLVGHARRAEVGHTRQMRWGNWLCGENVERAPRSDGVRSISRWGVPDLPAGAQLTNGGAHTRHRWGTHDQSRWGAPDPQMGQRSSYRYMGPGV
jgi:hypothetical protein